MEKDALYWQSILAKANEMFPPGTKYHPYGAVSKKILHNTIQEVSDSGLILMGARDGVAFHVEGDGCERGYIYDGISERWAEIYDPQEKKLQDEDISR